MELEKKPSGVRTERRSNVQSIPPGKSSSAESSSTVKDASVDHDLVVFLQALSAMQAASKERSGKQAREYNRDDIIHAVDMFFDTILSSEECSLAVKSLIGKLQIPVLKSAQVNGKFFTDARHPARRLIKALYVQASKIGPERKLETNPFYLSMQTTVKTVLKEFDGDERIFLRAYFDICQLAGP